MHSLLGGSLAYAAVTDNTGTSHLELLVGEPAEGEPQTIFEWFRKLWLKLSTVDTNTAPLVGKIDQMSADIASLNAKLNSVYTLNANNIFSNSQVKSTKVLQASPSQLLIKWDCSKDSDCTANSETPDRIDDSCMLKFNVYYSSIDASVKNMTFAGSVDYKPGKIYTDDYEFLISGLQSDATYYVWVTSVIDGDQIVELNDNSSVRVAKTMKLEDARVDDLSYLATGVDTLNVTWNDGLTGSNEKSEYVDHYNVYWSEEELTASNVLQCSESIEVTACSAEINGLDPTKEYCVAIVPVMNDETVGMVTEAIASINAILYLSKNGGQLIPVDLDGDCEDDAMLCTLSFGNTGQIKNQSQDTLDSLVSTYFTKKDSDYYSAALHKLIVEDGLTLQLLTNAQIDEFLVPNGPIEFVGENLEVGTAPNLAYSDSTRVSRSGSSSDDGFSYSWRDTYSGVQTSFDTNTWTKINKVWSGYVDTHDNNYYVDGMKVYSTPTVYNRSSTPTVRVGLIGYFSLEEFRNNS